MPYAKSMIKVKVPHRSGFDKSHRNSGTGLAGTLLPLLCDEVVPNSRVSLRVNLATQLPPLVSDTFMNVKHKVEAFFVPGRLLCKSYESWFCDVPARTLFVASGGQQSGGNFIDSLGAIPVLSFVTQGSTAVGNLAPAGSLLDYLGFGHNTAGASGDTFNMLPLLAYHLVWQEYYRNPSIQNPAFIKNVLVDSTSEGAASNPRIACAIDTFYRYAGGGINDAYLYSVDSTNLNSFKCADGVSLFDLRQRNYGFDYFTTARASAQQGSAAAVTLALPSGATSTSFSIAQLRAANSLQMFRERNNLPGTRLVDQVKARYGANLSDGVAQRPICIGSATYDYATAGVNQTTPAGSSTGGNLFSAVAAQYGRGYTSGSDFIIDDFVANEPGYVLVLHSLVPEASYSGLVDRMFMRYRGAGSIVDMANPLLQNVGDQPIFQNEVAGIYSSSAVFGYTDRYADFMFKPNGVHGLFRSGQSLASFVLQRDPTAYGTSPTISTRFLEIPTTALDSILQVPSTTSGLSFWYDSMLEYKVSMPLAEYSIPSLQDPAYEHGQSVNLRRNGQIF